MSYALTGMFLAAAASHTALNISTLSSIVQLIFFLQRERKGKRGGGGGGGGGGEEGGREGGRERERGGQN